MISISVIVTSYNQRSTIEFLLASLEQQTYRDFEVILADDGSSDQTEQFIEKAWGFSLRWVTQKDEGYRKSRILNEAIRQARADYLIFVDGDVVLERHFIQDHWQLRKVGHFVCGRRVDLGPEFSKQVSLNKIQNGFLTVASCSLRWSLFLSGWRGDSEGIKRGWRVPRFLRRWMGYHRPLDILGSNLGVWKLDLYAVNGFNEDLESYWGEDGDLYIRLRNSGRISTGAKGLCIQYHIFHMRRPVSAENVRRYQAKLEDLSYKWAKLGLDRVT